MCIHLIVLALCLTPCLPQSILQTPPMIVVSPGQPVKMNCTSTATGDPNMYWYRQPMTGGALVLVVLSYGKGSVEELTLKHFTAKRTKEKEAEFTLEIDKIKSEDAGVYYCAWSIDRGSSSAIIFGSGTVLHVLENGEVQSSPKVKIFGPNKQEFKHHNLISLVCVASGFYPEHVRLNWTINGIPRNGLYQNVASKKENDTSFSTSKRLTLTRSEYFNPENEFKCEASFIGNDSGVSYVVRGGQDCGVSKESYTMYINQGKISYIMVLFKSGLYALIVLAIIWRRKVHSGSC